MTIYRLWYQPCDYALHKPRRERPKARKLRREAEMKKLILSKVFRFLFNWLRSRLAPKRNGSGKPQFKSLGGGKKLSPRHEYLLKVSQLLKNRFRQTT
jgi:hypothetical protein